MKIFSAIILGGVLLAGATAPLTTYQVQSSASTVSFKINNMGIAVDGSLAEPTGTVVFDPNDLASSSVNASIAVSTIDTGIEMRDKDLKKEEYFDAEKYPTIKFQSSSISQTASGYQAKGKLTIKGTTKEVVIPFTVVDKVFKGNFKLDRLDYHVGESSWVLSDEVRVSFSLPVSEV